MYNQGEIILKQINLTNSYDLQFHTKQLIL
jgi:hypothetical protein